MHPDSFLLEEILLNILVGLSLWASLQWPIWVQRDKKLEEWSHSMTQLDLIMQVNANYEPQQHSAAALYSPLLCSSYWSWSLCSFSLLRGMFFFFFSCLTELTSVTSCNCSNFSGLIQKWEILEGFLVFNISELGEKNIVIVLACQLTSAMMHAVQRRWRNVMIIKHRNSGLVMRVECLLRQ